MRLSKELAVMAKEKSICEPGHERIAGAETIEELLKYYVEGIDFCLGNNFPSKEYLKKYGGDLLEKYGIFIGGTHDLLNVKFAVFHGKITANVDVAGYCVSELFVKDNGFLAVNAKGNAFVVIDAFDKAKIDVEVSGFSKVLVNLYGEAKVSVSETDAGVIKVVRKGKAGY